MLLCVKYPELRENALVERHLSDATAVAMCQRLGRAVAASHTDSLSQDLFKLRCRATCYQCPYQRQRVIIEVRLQRSQATASQLEPFHRSLKIHHNDRKCINANIKPLK